MNLQKNKPWRNEKYLKWVRSLPCCFSGRTEDVQAHHLIGVGFGGTMGGKASDLFVMPLNAEVHSRLHSDPKSIVIDQKKEVFKTIEKAVRDGVLIMGLNDPFDEWVDGLED